MGIDVRKVAAKFRRDRVKDGRDTDERLCGSQILRESQMSRDFSNARYRCCGRGGKLKFGGGLPLAAVFGRCKFEPDRLERLRNA